jgi:SAM-dependent methyltransferase
MALTALGTRTLHAARSIARQAAAVDVNAARIARHDSEVMAAAMRRRLLELSGETLREARVLDFGCGFTYPLLVLLRDDVREIIGLDVAPVFRNGLLEALRSAGGLKKPGTTLEALLRYIHAARYYRHLERSSGEKIRHGSYSILRYEGNRLPYEDSAFDCLVSNAVVQELPGRLERFAAEMSRVLRPGGALVLEWHNFYSWSGHYLGEGESRRNPWGHLLDGQFHPSLNRATPDQVLEAFSPWFSDLELLGHDAQYRIAGRDPAYTPEGAEYLTPDLEARLAEYPREWLLTRGYLLQARNR